MTKSFAALLLGKRWASVRTKGRARFIRHLALWVFIPTTLQAIYVSFLLHHSLTPGETPPHFFWGWCLFAAVFSLASYPIGLGLAAAAWAFNERLYQRTGRES